MTITTDRDQYEGARSNAAGHFEEILAAYREWQKDEGGRDEPADEMRERALSVEVRSPWYSPGAETPKPQEYAILLTTGGPGLRLWGELDEYGEPDSAQLQMQDWGVPWREVWPCEVEGMDEARQALLWFASLFYFGE